MNKILLVEDEEHIGHGIVFNLRKKGFEVTWAKDGIEGVEQFQEGDHDLILLDIMLPKLDGIGVLKSVRFHDKNIPVLILSAKDEVQDRIAGFKCGGDDYLAKPFDLEELFIRIQRLLDRTHDLGSSPNIDSYEFGKNQILFHQNKANTCKGEIDLTEQEIKLLKVFIEKKNMVLSREEILNKAWGYGKDVSTRTLDNFIVKLRKYFEEDSKRPKFFKSIRGKGYMFNETSKY